MARATKVNLNIDAAPVIEAEPIRESSLPREVNPDPWKEMVTLFIPRAKYGDKGRTETFSVNNVAWRIVWDGSKQQIPKPIAEIVQQVLADRYAEEDAIDNLPQESSAQPGVEGRNF